jgi:hypothetical protein
MTRDRSIDPMIAFADLLRRLEERIRALEANRGLPPGWQASSPPGQPDQLIVTYLPTNTSTVIAG